MTKLVNNIFRGYDLRGLVNSELNEETVSILGKAYATYLLQRRIYDCVVGYDCRLSSPEFSKIFIKALIEAGITVYDIGTSLTQMVYFACYYFRTRGSVMITASHNPKEYNGFKFGTGYSETMLSDDIQEFRKLAQSEKFISLNKKGSYLKKDIFEDYVKDVKRRIDKIGKFKIVVDSCAATTGLFLPKIFREYNCEVIEQNTIPDGNFPVGTPDPTEKDVLERLGKRVVQEKADIGFAYDADGDRLGIVGTDGKPIWNDVLFSIFAKDILDYLPGSKIIYNTLCSKQVGEVVEQNGGKPIIWITGHSFIKAKVREERAPFGGELSGHFYFVDNFYGHDDGAIASLRLLAYLTRVNKSVLEVISELPKYISSPEIKVGCADELKFNFVSKTLGDELKKLYPEAKFLEIDGVRMDLQNEMIIIRASQNGPYLTVKFEAKSQEKYEQMKVEISQLLHKYSEIDFKKGVNTSSLE